MRCVRSCGRKAQQGQRLCHLCHDNQLSRESERNLYNHGKKKPAQSVRRKADHVLDIIADKSRHR